MKPAPPVTKSFTMSLALSLEIGEEWSPSMRRGRAGRSPIRSTSTERPRSESVMRGTPMMLAALEHDRVLDLGSTISQSRRST